MRLSKSIDPPNTTKSWRLKFAREGRGRRPNPNKRFQDQKLALLVRVIASWLGFTYARWMRPVLALTGWMIRPLQRVIPPLGPLDITPIVAYLALILLESAIFTMLF